MDKEKKRAYMKEYYSRPGKKEKKNETRKRWYHKNKNKSHENVNKYRHKYRDRTRNTQLKTQYGFSLEEYNELLIKQNNVCAICGGNDERALSVDHNHNTNRIRGLLCRNCNNAIGLFKDNIELLLNAIKYLSSNK